MASIKDLVEANRPELEHFQELYKHLHRNPELSTQERETSETVVKELRRINSDFNITTSIGGHGIAAVLRNGEGPTVLLRADFDALPVKEDTVLNYASTKRMKDKDDQEKPVMHACGHDLHTTALLGATRLLSDARKSWSGTLVLIFQPAEELGTGSQAMVDDGLYKKHNVPIPDVAFGGHVMPLRAGSLGLCKGLSMNSADSMHLTIYGKGAHSSMPNRAIDPIIIASSLINKLQTIVSREMDPHDSTSVTVASIHGGDADNVIADEVVLGIDIRTASAESRKAAIASIKRMAECEAKAYRAPKMPTIEFTRQYPPTVNNEDAAEKLSKSFTACFGDNFDPDMKPLGGSEDFSNLATSVKKPYCFFFYGGTDPELWDKAEANGTLGDDIPANHSAQFAPVIMPTLQVGVDGYAAAALTWLS